MEKSLAVKQTEIYTYIDEILTKIEADSNYKNTVFQHVTKSLGTGQKRTSANEKDYQIIAKLVEQEFKGNLISDTSV